ncbi:MAG TPA: DegT/DnrJ/EryC1/StrS aminotransferase family protein [Candidatus Limnocylindrales bacterium]|nr:DegT/DnrJ/EryC1/StrS aminotransferase family protein [Candidatus Limnocylindrales bacterium]
MPTRSGSRGRVAADATAPADASPSADTTDPRPFLPFSRPSIGARERQAVIEVMDSGWLTTGARAKEFESQFAAFVGSTYAVALNSATAALHLSLDALGVGPGDEVIVPTWTFASSAEVVVYRGARPVLVDVDRESLNATVDGVLGAITAKTRAVIAVHIAGRPLAVTELSEALAARGVPLVEDAAHSFPSRLPGSGRLAGTIGTIGAYSFYATKTITTGEGGMLVTDDSALADRARLMSLHGISRNAWNRYTAAGSWYYEIEDAGFKYNMTDLAAALGIVQLSRADELLEARRALAAAYTTGIAASPIAELVEVPADPGDGSHAWHLYILRLRLDRLRIGRGDVIDGLKQLGIGTSVHFIPLHLHPYYRRVWGYAPADLPIAAAEFERVISLPLWPGMSMSDVDRVIAGLEQVLGQVGD